MDPPKVEVKCSECSWRFIKEVEEKDVDLRNLNNTFQELRDFLDKPYKKLKVSKDLVSSGSLEKGITCLQEVIEEFKVISPNHTILNELYNKEKILQKELPAYTVLKESKRLYYKRDFNEALSKAEDALGLCTNISTSHHKIKEIKNIIHNIKNMPKSPTKVFDIEIDPIPVNSCRKCLCTPGYYCPDLTFPDCSCEKDYDRVFCLGIYRGWKRGFGKIIWDYKEEGRSEYSRELGKILNEYLSRNIHLFKDTDFFVPVPELPRDIEERGYSPVGLLIEEIEKLNGFKILKDVLIPAKEKNRKQKHLSGNALKENVKGIYAIAKGKGHYLKNKIVILFDDLVKSDSTVNECSRVLKEAGVSKVYVLALARSYKG